MKYSGLVVRSVDLTLKRSRPRTFEMEVVAEIPFNGEEVTMAFDIDAEDVDRLAQICALARSL